METAIYRRLYEELGVYCPLEFLFKFQYQAQWDAHGAENELCSVYIGHTPSQIQADPAEIAGVRWVSPEQLQAEMAQHRPGQFTPWFIMEWERVWNDHRPGAVSTRS
jgi:isopentenyl-diphosphate Delta-isomerase